MEYKQKGRSQKQTTPKTTIRKGRYSCTPLQEIRSLFLTGKHFTARQPNAWTGSNYARKCISTLRKQGMNIKDKWFDEVYPNAPHIKVYWLESNGEKCLQSHDLSAGEQLSTNDERVQQNAAHEPKRVDNIIFNDWLPVFKQRVKNNSMNLEKGGLHEE